MRKHTIMVPAHTLDAVRARIIDIAGGCTVGPESDGYWKDDTGKIHIDRIHPVTVYETDTTARDTAVSMLHDAGELAVAYETDGVPAIVNA